MSRTYDDAQRFRKPPLYPTELRGRVSFRGEPAQTESSPPHLRHTPAASEVTDTESAPAAKLTGRSASDLARFLAKTKRAESGCLLWTGALQTNGYGSFGFGGRGRTVLAHRWIYEATVGPIPDGLTIDHLCREKRCQEVAHMEPVTAAENSRRSDNPSAINARREFCVHGHELAGENLRIRKDGRRQCRHCENRMKRESYRRENPEVQRKRPLAAYHGKVRDLAPVHAEVP